MVGMRRTSSLFAPVRRLARVALLALATVVASPMWPAAAPAHASTLPYTGAVAVDGMGGAMCTLMNDATVDCWGLGPVALGTDWVPISRSVPVTVKDVVNVAEVSVGWMTACVRHTGGTATCWGYEASNYTPGNYSDTITTPEVVAGLTNAVDIAAGFEFGCAVVSGGTVKCWGRNEFGQTGQPTSTPIVTTATTVPGLTNVVAITAGHSFVCARRSDETARCWGANAQGQLGRGTTDPSPTPVSPTGLSNVLSIDAGLAHACAIVQDGNGEIVRCWGSSSAGQVGDTSQAFFTTPNTSLTSLTDASSLALGVMNTCVIRQTGALACLGSNAFGQAGTGSYQPTFTVNPSAVPGLTGVVSAAVGTGTICALASGSLSCWGYNYAGSLGSGDNAMSVASPQPVVVGVPEFSPLDPARLLDTRPSGVTVDGVGQQGGVVAAGATVELVVAGRGGVSATARAVALNVTAVNPGAGGFVTVWPCDQSKPLASNLNVVAGVTRANLVVVKVPSSGVFSGKVCLSPSVSTHLLADVSGYMSLLSPFVGVTPQRLVDTRPGGETVDGVHDKGGVLTANQQYYFQISGRGGVPVGADAAVVNVTAVNPAGTGFVTVWPCSGAAPTASNVNVKAGVNVANLVFAKLDAGGGICVKASVGTHLIVDLAGYMPDGSGYEPMVPFRLMDTRPSGVTVDGMYQGGGPQLSGGAWVGRGTVVVARTLVLNVTVVNPAAGGYITVYPCREGQPPNASNVNFAAGVTTPNAVVVKVGSWDSVCFVASTAVDVIIDLQGVYAY